MNRLVGTSLLSLLVLVGCSPQASVETNEASSAAQTAVTQSPPIEPRVAEVGVGIKGKSLENETGIGQMIASPAVTLFRVKEKAVFEIQIPQAMHLNEALEGRKPRSHEEFMQKIIDANRIALPKLPDGQVYKYHPDDGQLWVEPAQ